MMNLLQGMATVGATSQGWLSGKVPGLPELSEDEKKGIQKYSSWVQVSQVSEFLIFWADLYRVGWVLPT